MSKAETIRGQTRYRSGKYYSFRKCPKHNAELELCINDTDFSEWSAGHQLPFNHHENRIEWRCDSCLIFWNENYFFKKASPQIKLPISQLIMICPVCGSKRVTHECEPACCTNHYCIDCNTRFTADIELVENGYGEKTVQKVDDYLETEFCPSSSLYESGETTLTGIVRNYRKCLKHQEEALELVFIQAIDGIPTKIAEPAWYCKLCKRVYFENGGYRIRHCLFSYEVHAAVECPSCSSYDINSVSNFKNICVCECLSCGASLKVRLHTQSEHLSENAT